MDNGWSKAIHVGKLSEEDDWPVVVDMDPAAEQCRVGQERRPSAPTLPTWSGA
jgi:hypothetical protein